MKLYHYFLLVGMLFCINGLLAQNQLFILKDSTFLVGEVVNYSNDQLIIKSEKDIVAVNKIDILEIFKSNSKLNYYEGKNINFYNISDIGMLAGKRDGNEKYSFSFNMVNGAKYKDKASLGLGFGIEFMDINIIPLFGDIRYNINNGDLQCFVGMQAGYAFPLEKSEVNMVWNEFTYKKGVFYNPMIGVKANFNESKNAFLITLGYRHMNIIGERWDDWWIETKYEREFIYDRLSFRVGYVFN